MKGRKQKNIGEKYRYRLSDTLTNKYRYRYRRYFCERISLSLSTILSKSIVNNPGYMQ